MTERITVPVRIKGCPLKLEGRAVMIKTTYEIRTISYEHCSEGETLLIHHLTAEGKYIKTDGCNDCKLKNVKIRDG